MEIPTIERETIRFPADVLSIQFLLQKTVLNEDVVLIIVRHVYAVDRFTARLPPDFSVARHNSGAIFCRAGPILKRTSFRRTVDGKLRTAEVRNSVKEVVFQIRAHGQGFAADPKMASRTFYTASVRRGRREAIELELARNKTGERVTQEHVVVLRRNGGQGKEQEWVEALEAGDVVEVRAHAEVIGW
jgi:hypothetical protein